MIILLFPLSHTFYKTKLHWVMPSQRHSYTLLKNAHFKKINFTRLTSLLLGDPLTLQSCVSLILYCIVWYQDHVSFKFHLPPGNNQTYPHFYFPFTKTTSLSPLCVQLLLNACLILLRLSH